MRTGGGLGLVASGAVDQNIHPAIIVDDPPGKRKKDFFPTDVSGKIAARLLVDGTEDGSLLKNAIVEMKKIKIIPLLGFLTMTKEILN